MKKPLSKTNPYLRDPAVRDRLIRRSAITSCGVEGIVIPENSESLVKITNRRPKKIYERKKLYESSD